MITIYRSNLIMTHTMIQAMQASLSNILTWKRHRYRIGGNFRGMKFSRISRMIPASRIYNREHFMHQQCKILDMMPPGENLLEYRLEPIIKQFNTPPLRIAKRTNTRNLPRQLYAQKYCHRFALPLQTYRFCFPVLLCKSRFLLVLYSTNLYIQVISRNAIIENKCKFIHNGTC